MPFRFLARGLRSGPHPKGAGAHAPACNAFIRPSLLDFKPGIKNKKSYACGSDLCCAAGGFHISASKQEIVKSYDFKPICC